MAETIEGYVQNIVYRNQDNGYTVMMLAHDDEETTCVGSFVFINEGEYLLLTGQYTEHAVYGEQFQVSEYEVKQPKDAVSMQRYLGSGAIKGVGEALAARIVKKFGDETFSIIEEEPERLAEIKGIGERMAQQIYAQFNEKHEMRNVMIFLQQYGITTNLAVKIYNTYGKGTYEVLKTNPYKLAEDISMVGFKIADDIASRIGIGSDSDYRIKAGLLYMMSQASASGHVYLPKDMLLETTGRLLMIEPGRLERQFNTCCIERKLIVEERDDEKRVYSASMYYIELNTARMLFDLNNSFDIDIDKLDNKIEQLSDPEKLGVELDDIQRTAVAEAAGNGVFILTGGPGTGKTTTINAIIKLFEEEGMDILLAAPTGRAAKRMTETTGCEARTIHRLLEINAGGGGDDPGKVMSFGRNESNPLEADVIIIDETSMVDIALMNSLLRAIIPGTRLILVGDENQLPSVGPGNVLHDIIASDCFKVVRLTKVFRQAAESDIVINAHKINHGEQIQLDNKSKDFFLLQRNEAAQIQSTMVALVRDKLPKYVNASPFSIQVLTPMRKGELGVERLNQILQYYINPESPDKKTKEAHGCIFREGDKVMQVKNNYQITWEIRSRYGIPVQSGTGVFNGDCGIIRDINQYAELVTVEFDEGRMVEYPYTELDELELAYAITIHKSQGSEYPAVVIPLLTGPKQLFHRNILYTAVTRAKSCVAIVGDSNTVREMISNIHEQTRFSGLVSHILDCKKSVHF